MGSAAIVGTGLIGASVGLALRSAGWEVAGWDPSQRALEAAREVGALTEVAAGPEGAWSKAELVVLAGPPRAIVETVQAMNVDALVMDIGGVKQEVVQAARHLGRFVGTHPMAGREHVGPEAASAALFRGAAWIVVDDGASPDDLARVEAVIETCGAIPLRMSAEEHDVAVALISHLPHVVAATLVEAASDHTRALELASGSFRDLTRVALSDPGMWANVLIANRVPVIDAIHELVEKLHQWEHALEGGDAPTVQARLDAARVSRQALAPPIVAVRVYLEDKPGELAGVGRALASSRVDVRDLQLRHGEHGGGGVLTLSVRPGEAEALKVALGAEGFELD